MGRDVMKRQRQVQTYPTAFSDDEQPQRHNHACTCIPHPKALLEERQGKPPYSYLSAGPKSVFGPAFCVEEFKPPRFEYFGFHGLQAMTVPAWPQ